MAKALVLNRKEQKFLIEDRPKLQPEADEVLIKHLSIGLNDLDIFDFHDENGPQILGYEGCGIIEAIGPQVDKWSIGDQVCYISREPGSFAQMRCIASKMLIKKPDDIDHRILSALFLKGLLAHAITARAFVVRPGIRALVHDVCNSTSQVIIEFIKSRGGSVIGTIPLDTMKESVSQLGCDLILNYNSDSYQKDLMEFTKNLGVHIVYENMATRMLKRSVNCLGNFGVLLCYGGSIESVPYHILTRKSLFFTAPSVFDYKCIIRNELVLSASEVFQMIRDKKLTARYRECTFIQVIDAINAIETGKIDDSIVIMP